MNDRYQKKMAKKYHAGRYAAGRTENAQVVNAQPAKNEEIVMATQQEIFAGAENLAYRDNLRSLLARQALTNTAALSKLEETCNQFAPGGSDEYRKILQAYALRAAQEIYNSGF